VKNVMRPLVRLAVAALLGLAAAASPRAIALTLTGLDIARALDVAKQGEAARASFHAPYIVKFDDPVVERIEVVTEFRRAELIGEDRVRLGDYMFTVRRAQAEIAPWRGQVAIRAHLRFNPQNAYVTVPEYMVAVSAAGDLPAPTPLSVTRTAIFAMATPSKTPTGQPILGAVVESLFDAASIGQTLRSVSVDLRDGTVALATVNFSRIE